MAELSEVKRAFQASTVERDRHTAAKVVAEAARAAAEAQLATAKAEVGQHIAEAERARHELARAVEMSADQQARLDAISSSGGAASIKRAESQAKQLRELKNVLKCPIDPVRRSRRVPSRTLAVGSPRARACSPPSLSLSSISSSFDADGRAARHGAQDVWPRLLQEGCRRTRRYSQPEMSAVRGQVR